MTPTEHLLAFAAARHALPDKVRADTLRLLADTLAVGAAGSTGPAMDAVLAVARSWGRGDAARLIAREERLPAMGAAYANCYAIHALEWDAVHEGAVVHAMSAVVPAVMAAVDRRGGADPEAVLAAIAVGVDVAAGLGVAAETALTFFRPATAGIFGAALAVARIEELPESAFADVLGMAHAHAAGTMQAHTEGSIALPLQFANAARGAIHAVDLVRQGLTAAHNVIEGPFGHLRLFDRGNLETYTRTLGSRWLISEVSTKPFPSGRASHAVLATLQRFPRPPLSGPPVDRVDAHVPPLIRHLVGRPHDPGMTPAYARLCLPFLAALMLRDGEIDPRRFTSETFVDPELAALAARVLLHDDGNPDPNALSPQRLVVVLADGSRTECLVPVTLGSPDAPLSALETEAKRDLCRRLAFSEPDPRLFDDPLSYITGPA